MHILLLFKAQSSYKSINPPPKILDTETPGVWQKAKYQTNQTAVQLMIQGHVLGIYQSLCTCIPSK